MTNGFFNTCTCCQAKGKYTVNNQPSCGRHVVYLLEMEFQFQQGIEVVVIKIEDDE